jgi:hypothetical protein
LARTWKKIKKHYYSNGLFTTREGFLTNYGRELRPAHYKYMGRKVANFEIIGAFKVETRWRTREEGRPPHIAGSYGPILRCCNCGAVFKMSRWYDFFKKKFSPCLICANGGHTTFYDLEKNNNYLGMYEKLASGETYI